VETNVFIILTVIEWFFLNIFLKNCELLFCHFACRCCFSSVAAAFSLLAVVVLGEL